MLDLVLQEHTAGCGVACIAMVTGISYRDITYDFERDFNEEGLTLEEIMNYLGDKGFSVLYKTVSHYAKINFAEKELLKPFAPIHIVRTAPCFDSKRGHLVVMDSRGKFYCPSGLTHKQTQNSYSFTDMIGLYGLDYFLKPDILENGNSSKK